MIKWALLGALLAAVGFGIAAFGAIARDALREEMTRWE